jgi:hypothetical protein
MFNSENLADRSDPREKNREIDEGRTSMDWEANKLIIRGDTLM